MKATRPSRSFLPTASGVGSEAALHPCVAYPDLYPDETPPLGAGSIHAYAGMFLCGFVTSRLQDRNAGEPFAVEFDAPLYRAPHDYVVPAVYAHTRLRQPRGSASTYHLKQDGAPDLVVEIISASTWDKDVGLSRHTQLRDKRDFYCDLGVTEYWIYELEDKRKDKICLFEGIQWADGNYWRIGPDASRRWPSPVLQTHWTVGPLYIMPDGRQLPWQASVAKAMNRWYFTREEQKTSIVEISLVSPI